MAQEQNPAQSLDDLKPREQSPEQAEGVRGGLQPPHGIELTTPLPNEPPNG